MRGHWYCWLIWRRSHWREFAPNSPLIELVTWRQILLNGLIIRLCARAGAIRRAGHFLANAGVEGAISSILDYDEDVFDRLMAVNVKGPFLGLKAVVPEMIKRLGGSVIITSSVAGVRGGARLAPYVTSKHAVIGLMKSAAREFASHNIRVNTVNPSPVSTRMIESIEKGLKPEDPDSVREAMRANIPLGDTLYLKT